MIAGSIARRRDSEYLGGCRRRPHFPSEHERWLSTQMHDGINTVAQRREYGGHFEGGGGRVGQEGFCSQSALPATPRSAARTDRRGRDGLRNGLSDG